MDKVHKDQGELKVNLDNVNQGHSEIKVNLDKIYQGHGELKSNIDEILHDLDINSRQQSLLCMEIIEVHSKTDATLDCNTRTLEQ